MVGTKQSPSRLTTAVGVRILRTRALVRAPIWVYRARLGFLFGSRLLMLEHTGRATGIPRQVVLEVIDHPDPDTYVVASGFGRRAQWFRNVRANPRVRVQVRGRGPRPATARVLGPGEAGRVLAAYRRRHPRAWDRFRPVLEETLGEHIGETDPVLPMVELRLDPA
jgi:deazaflavin-dependent oxidoreductase (nitroreductase family)